MTRRTTFLRITFSIFILLMLFLSPGISSARSNHKQRDTAKAGGPAASSEVKDQEARVQNAAETLAEIVEPPDRGILRGLLDRDPAIAVVPQRN